mgnify:CR=1 FL=1
MTAGKTLGRIRRTAANLENHQIDWAARCELDDREIDNHDPEQCRDHQQHAADDVGEHPPRSFPALGAKRRILLRIDPRPATRPELVFFELFQLCKRQGIAGKRHPAVHRQRPAGRRHELSGKKKGARTPPSPARDRHALRR